MNERWQKQTRSGWETIIKQGDPEGPTFVIFHGFGADYEDLLPLSGVYSGQPQATWIFPNAPLEVPIGPHWVGRAWFPIDMDLLHRAMMEGDFNLLTEAFPEKWDEERMRLQDFLEALHVPYSKLFLGGFSQGGILATDLALHFPQQIGGLLIFSGILVHENVWKPLAKTKAGLPFFQSHGKNDPLLPLSKAHALETMLIEAGCKGKLHVFPGGHEIPVSVYVELRKFLEHLLENKSR